MILLAATMRLQRYAFVAGDDVEMQMVNGLPSGRLVELHHRDPVRPKSLLGGNGDPPQQWRDRRKNARIRIKQISGLRLRYNQCMADRLWHDIHEDNGVLVFKHLVTGYVTEQNFREDIVGVIAGGHGRSPTSNSSERRLLAEATRLADEPHRDEHLIGPQLSRLTVRTSIPFGLFLALFERGKVAQRRLGALDMMTFHLEKPLHGVPEAPVREPMQ